MTIGVNRRPVAPGAWSSAGAWVETDLSQEDPAVQAFATEHWTADVVAALKVAFPYVAPAPIDLKAYAANKRWQIETGGITVAGATISTTRDNQAMITGAYTFARDNPGTTIKFKSASGWVSLPAAAMVAIGSAVGAHVQASFAAEELIDADIDGGKITTTAQIDADSRWPAT